MTSRPSLTIRSLSALPCIWILLVGAQCQRSKPSCEATDGEPELICDEGEVRACISRCVPLGDVGSDCSLDPCDTPFVCPNGTTCDAGTSKCEQTASMLILGCDDGLQLGSAGFCSSNTYCASFEACNLERPQWLESVESSGMCVLPLGEGSICQSDWTALVDGEVRQCEVCEAGTVCEERAGVEGERICQRECSSDEQCPCGVTCNLEVGFCDVPCIENREECTVGRGLDCCDTDCLSAVVPTVSGEPTTVSFCCQPTNSTCEVDDDCCPNATCLGGLCTPCGAWPGADPIGAGCCEFLGLELDLEGGVCRRGCPLARAGRECGPSTACPDVPAVYVCDPILGDVCGNEIADGREVGDPCVSTEHTTCYASATGGYATIRGRLECGPTGLFCKSEAFIDVCFGAGGVCGDGDYCIPQQAPPYPCSTDSDCAPGYGCRNTTLGGGSGDAGFGGTTGQGCVPCGEGIPECWHPGANSAGCEIEPTAGACP